MEKNRVSSQAQSSYIADLAVAKTKEFKEVKELIISSGIVGEDATIVEKAQSIAEITNALTDLQASKLIDTLSAAKEPARATQYSQKRIDKATRLIDDVKSTIDSWDFS